MNHSIFAVLKSEARDLVPLLRPGDALGDLGPELVGIAQRAIVHGLILLHVTDTRAAGELLGDGDDALLAHAVLPRGEAVYPDRGEAEVPYFHGWGTGAPWLRKN